CPARTFALHGPLPAQIFSARRQKERAGVPTMSTQTHHGQASLFGADTSTRRHPRQVLSYGLGLDSTAVLLRWLTDPSSRDFDLSDLVVITAMTGDEFSATGADVERYVLPELRRHRVRFVQVGRHQL